MNSLIIYFSRADENYAVGYIDNNQLYGKRAV